jgi:MraZ protein
MRDCPLDKSGRFSLPAEYRKELPEKLVIVQSWGEDDKYLKIYGAADYEQWIEDYFNDRGGYKRHIKQHKKIRDRLHHIRHSFEADDNGRLSVPKHLLEYAGLQPGKTVKVCGSYDHVQVWNPDAYDAFCADSDDIALYVDDDSFGNVSELADE